MPSSRNRSTCLKALPLALLIPFALISTHISAQSAADAAGCTLQKDIYTCNWRSFRAALDRAHSVRVETQGLDRSTAAQLRHLAQKLGKQVAADDQPADLTFLLIPIEPTGVDLGPAAHDLATLRIYAPGSGTTRGALLWAETYRGQPDRPWPAIANATIQQFRDRLSEH